MSVKFLKAKNGRAEIILYGDVGFEITPKEFSNEIKGLGKFETLSVRINSFGGDVFDGVTIYNRLKELEAKIEVSIDGIAASIASVIAMAGDSIRIGEAAFIMIHDAWTMTMGNADELRKTAGRLEAVSEQISTIYQKRTKQPMEQIREWMIAETEFDAEQSIEFGFADELFESEKIAAKFDKPKFDAQRHHFRRKPSILLPKKRAEARRLVAEQRMLQIGR